MAVPQKHTSTDIFFRKNEDGTCFIIIAFYVITDTSVIDAALIVQCTIGYKWGNTNLCIHRF